MKYIKKISESFTKSEEEVLKAFEEAFERGNSTINIDALHKEFGEFVFDKHLYDDFYLYKDFVFQLTTHPSGDWYVNRLSKIDKADVFKERISNKIEELKKALIKVGG